MQLTWPKDQSDACFFPFKKQKARGFWTKVTIGDWDQTLQMGVAKINFMEESENAVKLTGVKCK